MNLATLRAAHVADCRALLAYADALRARRRTLAAARRYMRATALPFLLAGIALAAYF